MDQPSSIEVQAIYFRLYEAYILQSPSLKMYYEMLLDLYKKHPVAFRILSKLEIERLGQIQRDIKTNSFSLFCGNTLLSDILPDIPKEKTDLNHIEICKYLIKNPYLLEPYTGPIDFINSEHPVRFGSIDIVVQSDRTIFIIEVKTETANHSILGQIQKYYVGLALLYSLKMFDEIKIITLCPGYDPYTYKDLLRISAKPLVLNTNPFIIKELIA